MTGENKLDRLILDALLGDARSRRFDSMHVRDVRQWDGHMRAIIPTRTDNQYKRLLSRLVVSAIGAGFLIGPMWLMMIQRGLHVALVSTTVFVVVFGALAAFFLDSPAHVLSSTAAYAAVLFSSSLLRRLPFGEPDSVWYPLPLGMIRVHEDVKMTNKS
ncbi:hypothetical protein N658DRAFT_502556 [Parathielavia hyrcaniae]|uniref:DUF6594 domain-containing protein n=1 Tax=Parathielavia hyrcaniae TaxID=113614 RepID=A0AAN6T5Z4_9PEZI|nr:hypothetical protein N658DRAFT_502556 [Parathielavia hyrcaniae]